MDCPFEEQPAAQWLREPSGAVVKRITSEVPFELGASCQHFGKVNLFFLDFYSVLGRATFSPWFLSEILVEGKRKDRGNSQ